MHPAHLISMAASIFPWDPQTDSAMAHHHLVLGYAFAWTAQLLYLLSVLWRQRTQNKTAAAVKADRQGRPPLSSVPSSVRQES
jgi:hypothetical protein